MQPVWLHLFFVIDFVPLISGDEEAGKKLLRLFDFSGTFESMDGHFCTGKTVALSRQVVSNTDD